MKFRVEGVENEGQELEMNTTDVETTTCSCEKAGKDVSGWTRRP